MSGRSSGLGHHTPSMSRQLSNIKKATMNGTGSSDNVLTSLRATTIITSKPVLPAELLDAILDYVPTTELMLFARVSRRMREMVYDDTRWIQKLRAMGVWNESEARQKFDENMKKKSEMQRIGTNTAGGGTGGGRQHAGSVTLFDAGIEEDRFRQSHDNSNTQSHRRRQTLTDGFDDLVLSTPSANGDTKPAVDPAIALNIFNSVRSIRGQARQEFAKIYAALAPIYNDLFESRCNSDAKLFRTYRDPEQQAQILSNLKRFSRCDTSQGSIQRAERLSSVIGTFENAVIREFEQGYAAGDYDGRMHRYAHVLVTMNGGASAMDAFLTRSPVMSWNDRPLDCLEDVAPGHVDLNPSQIFFERLAGIMVEQSSIIDRVFPSSVDVLTPLLSRLCEDIISEYVTILYNGSRIRGGETFVKAFSGTFEQALRFVASLKPTKASPPDFAEQAKVIVTKSFEKHMTLYLEEELAVFKTKSEAEISHWDKELSDQEASAESFFMSNINRQAVKRDFLSSFKKVVMMPVNVLPAFPLSKPAKPVNENLSIENATATGSRPRTPTLNGDTSTPQQEAPTTELAAKAALMNSRLEGIKSLFSIEVALSLTHLAKQSLERTANVVRTGSKHGEDAKAKCKLIFVTLLHLLGDRHIKNGFDKAVGHLGSYNPRQVREIQKKAATKEADEESRLAGVAPLMTFLELVNVGDLIQQMIDVFYAQELVAAKITDRDDFLDPAVKEKKRFEQMLDERVAAGLNKGIDVLIEEVEYICASTQVATDFNPGVDQDSKSGFGGGIVDIGVSNTAKQVVDMVSGHTSMLVGSTDKNMLDVFMQEVGLRLFGALCKHVKRQRISVDGAIKLISDLNHYSAYVATLRQKPLAPYFQALRELGQIYLVHIDPPAAYFGGNGKRGSILSSKNTATAAQSKELAAIVADSSRYVGIFPTEEVYEFAERRADWYLVKGDVEKAMYGVGCSIM